MNWDNLNRATGHKFAWDECEPEMHEMGAAPARPFFNAPGSSRALNYTCTALLILAALYFGSRILVAFTSGRAQQRIHQIETEQQPRMRVISLEVH